MPVRAPAPVLRRLGIGEDAFLGAGSEAAVYALPGDRVARVHGAGVGAEAAAERAALLDELAASAARVPFALPRVLERTTLEDRCVCIEARLPGRSLDRVLGETDGPARERLVRAYLDASGRIGDLRLARRHFGDLSERDPVRTATFRAYLAEKARRGLAGAGAAAPAVDPEALAAALPEPVRSALVHLDAFPGNMLAEGERITAVIDFASSALMGDRRLDPVASAVYLAPPMTPAASDGDRRIARAWLREHELDALFDPVRRWLAAYWSFAQDDRTLAAWCHEVLAG